MRLKILGLVALNGLLIFSGCKRDGQIFISQLGSDGNPGTKKAPFATLHAAKEKVRLLVKQSQNRDITVWLDGGTFFMDEPEIFTSEDSGPNSFSIEYKALPGEVPIISGGLEIKGWQRTDNGLWVAKVPGKRKEKIYPRELFIDGKRAVRARHPNGAFVRVKETGSDKRTNFFFETGDFPLPKKAKEVELVLLHDWSISRIRLDTIISELNQLVASDSIGARIPEFFTIDNWEKNPRYYLENAIEFVDEANEWFFNSEDRKIYLKLPSAMTPDSMNIVVPFVDGLIQFDGSETAPVSNIKFDGITFSYCQWKIPNKGYGGIQACHYGKRDSGTDWGVVPAAVMGQWMNDITFENCVFEHLGGSGLWLSTGSKNCSIVNCTVSDVSGNGIMIGEGRDRQVKGAPWWQSAPEQVANGNLIDQSTVTNCGQQFYGAVGIWCGLTANTTIRRNEVYNMPYTGISIGWMWNPEPTPCEQNIVEGNHIHHIMGKLSDGGGIYMLGLQPGSRLMYNHIHDVEINAGRAESNGMFLDEGITDVIVEGNLIYNIAKSPLRFHKATTNLVKGNILICGDNTPPIRYNRTKEDDIEKIGNKVLKSSDIKDDLALGEVIRDWEENNKENTYVAN